MPGRRQSQTGADCTLISINVRFLRPRRMALKKRHMGAWPAIQGETKVIKKILCATDGAPHSERAVELAAELAATTKAELILCTVNIMRGGGRAPLLPMLNDDEVEKILNSAASIAKKAGVSPTHKVALSARDAAGSIVNYCETNSCDHIVTGTGDKHGVQRLVLGSVAADVVSKAHCPVTVAR